MIPLSFKKTVWKLDDYWKGANWTLSWEAKRVQARDKRGMHCCSAPGDKGKWVDSRQILEVKLTGFASKMIIQNEQKRGIKYEFQVLT